MRLALLLALAMPLVGQFWSPDREPITLKWCVSALPASPSEPEVRGAINEALREWSKYVEIKFRYGDCGAERTLTFSWATGDHACGWPFQPESLAHAYWPPPWTDEPRAGDVHFNAALTWTAALIYRVALHEIGHALGVVDSNVWYSVMRYEGNAERLAPSDIAAVRKLYGRRCFEIECAMRYDR
jgi:predicted Zn-dependent protease